MDTDMMIALGAVAVVALLLAYNFVRGIHGSLSSASVGEVYNFEYEQPLHGERKRILAKVIEPVCKLSDDAIKSINRNSRYRRYDPVFKRTNHLVTCMMPNGDIRQFYAERAKNVRRSVLGSNLFKAAALFA